MRFEKGNTDNLKRKTRGGGPRRSRPLQQEIDALKRDKTNVPAYLKRISDIALNASDDKLALQAAMYLIDRHEGKAKQTSEVAITPRAYSTDDYELMAQVQIAQDKLLLGAASSSYVVGGNGGDPDKPDGYASNREYFDMGNEPKHKGDGTYETN